jgi:MoaA/NifB/PqqE/SkfB family radical SAM enzyme
LSCSYCPVSKKQGFIAEKIAFKSIDLYLDSMGEAVKKIKIFGGEPLLNIPLLKEIITYIRKKSLSVQIDLTTNGVFLNASLALWLKESEVNIFISIDGDFQAQKKNRKGMTKKNYDNIFKSLKSILGEVTFNMVIAPNNAGSFMNNFLYLHKAGVKKFNLLPAAYVPWEDEKIRIFKGQMDVLGFFMEKNKDVYLKNSDRRGNLFFLNTGAVIDANGDVFLTDAVMLNEFQKIKDDLKIGNISNMSSFDFIKQKDIQSKIDKNIRLISKATAEDILKSNEEVDSLMDGFVSDLQAGKAGKKLVDIKIGYQCNNHCFFCAQGDKRSKCSFRKKEKIEKELSEARANYASLVLTGGEPTLHPDFLHLVRFAKKLDFKTIQIQTNGRMFAYKKFCREAVGAGATEFSPALHGHSAKLHDYLTGAEGSFNQTVSGIKNLKELGQPVITNTVVTKLNYKYLPEIAKILIALDVDQFQFAFVHIVGSAWQNRNWLVPRKSAIMPYVKRGVDMARAAGKNVVTEAIPFCLMKGYEDCIAERVIPDAKVIERNLTVESFTDYRQSFGKAKSKRCKKCAYFSICEGPWREYPKLFGWSEFNPVIS